MLGMLGILRVLTQFGTHAIQAALCNSKYTNAPCHPAPMGDLPPSQISLQKRKNSRKGEGRGRGEGGEGKAQRRLTPSQETPRMSVSRNGHSSGAVPRNAHKKRSPSKRFLKGWIPSGVPPLYAICGPWILMPRPPRGIPLEQWIQFQSNFTDSLDHWIQFPWLLVPNSEDHLNWIWIRILGSGTP